MNQLQNSQLQLKFKLKLWKTDGAVKRWHTTKIKRIRAILKAEKFQKAYLKVSYGKQNDTHGKVVAFYNDGKYDNKNNLRLALNAFTEDSRKNVAETIITPARN